MLRRRAHETLSYQREVDKGKLTLFRQSAHAGSKRQLFKFRYDR